MGKVYLAENDRGERVAIKVLPPRRALEDENALVRFRREMDLSRRCSHPNVARTLDVGSEGDVHFMVMEYIPGESLFEMVKGSRAGPLRVPDAARLFLKLIDGLDAAHRAGPDPSRHQAVERHDHARRRGEAARPGPGPGPGRREGHHPGQHRARHARLRQPRAARRRQQGRPPQRPVQRRLHALLRPLGPGPVRGGRHDQQDLQAADGGPPAAGVGGPRRPGGVRRARPQADEQEARRALPGLPPSSAPTWPAGPTRAASAPSWAPRPRPPAASARRRPSSTRTTSASSTATTPTAAMPSPSASLGDPEPSVAPRHQHPLPPLAAVVRPSPPRETRIPRRRPRAPETTPPGSSSSR